MSKVTYYKTAADRIAERIIGKEPNKRTVSALARAIGEPRETVSGWLKHPHRLPFWGAVALMQAIGMSAEEIAREVKK